MRDSTEDGGGGSYGCGGRTVSEGHSAAWHPARPPPPTPREQPTPTPAPTSHFRSSPTPTQPRTEPPGSPHRPRSPARLMLCPTSAYRVPPTDQGKTTHFTHLFCSTAAFLDQLLTEKTTLTFLQKTERFLLHHHHHHFLSICSYTQPFLPQLHILIDLKSLILYFPPPPLPSMHMQTSAATWCVVPPSVALKLR